MIENICTKKTYKQKDGTEKISWNNVGTLVTNNDGKKFISLHMFPQTQFYIFPKKDNDINQDYSSKPSF